MKKIKTLKTINDLLNNNLIADQEVEAYQKVADKFSISITPAMLALILAEDDQGPIRQQFVPSVKELTQTSSELKDPIGDEVNEAVKGVIHRYPDRCLLKVVNVCPVYCRFCFRKELIGPHKASLSASELQNAYEYIRSHPEIWEVILTGGDPFILKPKKLREVLGALEEIKHVDIIRIHTRIPVVDPSRIDLDLLTALKCHKTVFVVLHINHPKELTFEVEAACAKLIDRGIPMLSQSVLLKGINDNADILSQLMRKLVKNRIKPYYLHHPDQAKGTSHFRLKIEEGQQLMKELQGKISGLCQPTYMLEIPGGYGKMPINPSYAKKEEGIWFIRNHEGEVHEYHE